VLLRDEVSLWVNASDETQDRVKVDLLEVLTHESSASIRRKLCDTVGELASSILEEGTVSLHVRESYPPRNR
jgi:hypothetical protein